MSETLVQKVVEKFRTVHRVVLPIDGDVDTFPLYVDFNLAQSSPTELSKKSTKTIVPSFKNVAHRPDFVIDRRSMKIGKYERVSFGTYFNAFPASYWRAHTNVSKVRLSLEVSAAATVFVYRSNARGSSNRVASKTSVGAQKFEFDLLLNTFGDGGWYWFDVVSSENEVVVHNASWAVPEPKNFVPKTVSLAVTTFNRPDYCVKNLELFGQTPELLQLVDKIIITDQGTKKVADQTGFAEVSLRLGEKLQIFEQKNLGGSGGFSRGMYETVQAEVSEYVMLLDDDVLIETEGILRAVDFANFTRKPTIVGGHMFNLFERAVLHSFGEKMNEYRFFWEAVNNTVEAHDFSAQNLRSTPWMHRRVDVDYNGWWMCLIPIKIVKEIGLSLPVFIKWDDAEYSIRAKENGYETVSLPGAAVWHMPWIDKDDSIDWQAYFHQRNRWVTALLHSPYKNGGNLGKESFIIDIKHLLSMQYSTVELRLDALEDILNGWEHLHETIGTKLGEIRDFRTNFVDSTLIKDVAQFPQVKRLRLLPKGKQPVAPENIVTGMAKALTGGLRQLRKVEKAALEYPEDRVPAMDARWWRLAQLDSALVSVADGSGVFLYQRNSQEFRFLLRRSIFLHNKLRLKWKSLAKNYQQALPEFTSFAAWEKTFFAQEEIGDQKIVKDNDSV